MEKRNEALYNFEGVGSSSASVFKNFNVKF